ncbi:MAG TPA: hypothetical protein PLZ75_12835, partial [Bacteroidales bacterium]|nr:hypothetical protein [Bacteroidales bacterium]
TGSIDKEISSVSDSIDRDVNEISGNTGGEVSGVSESISGDAAARPDDVSGAENVNEETAGIKKTSEDSASGDYYEYTD